MKNEDKGIEEKSENLVMQKLTLSSTELVNFEHEQCCWFSRQFHLLTSFLTFLRLSETQEIFLLSYISKYKTTHLNVY